MPTEFPLCGANVTADVEVWQKIGSANSRALHRAAAVFFVWHSGSSGYQIPSASSLVFPSDGRGSI